MEWKTTSTVLERLGDFEDDAIWQLVLEHFQEPIQRLARRMGLPPSDAQDATQETLIAFAQGVRAGQFDRSKGRLKDWLFGIARRQMQGARRRVATNRDRAVAEATAFLRDVPDEGELAGIWEEEWRRAVYLRVLKRVQTELRPETVQIYHLATVEGLAVEEIASRLGVPPTRVYNAKHRVAKRVRELAAEYEDV